MYRWTDVAARTQAVYDAAASSSRDDSLIGRLRRYFKCGRVFGKICTSIAAVDVLLWTWLRWWQPASRIEVAPDFPRPSVTCTIAAICKDKLDLAVGIAKEKS